MNLNKTTGIKNFINIKTMTQRRLYEKSHRYIQIVLLIQGWNTNEVMVVTIKL